jgi:hypothetical protein
MQPLEVPKFMPLAYISSEKILKRSKILLVQESKFVFLVQFQQVPKSKIQLIANISR